MNQPERFSVGDSHAEYRPTGRMSLRQAVQLITEAITYARDHQLRNLLIDTTHLTGFPPPSLFDRYFFIKEWAGASRGAVRVVLVARPEMIDAGKFGVMVAANHGLIADVFVSDDEALRWLKAGTERAS
jgi:hypothetical protein